MVVVVVSSSQVRICTSALTRQLSGYQQPFGQGGYGGGYSGQQGGYGGGQGYNGGGGY